ncbi:branched-chain amino acid aminotransferase [Arcanobacterium haemolyticum]|nr:branched-chain amino acid aminotransferase [Arcanobacterium haemolyticum]
MTHSETALEKAAAQPVANADELAHVFTRQPHPHAASPQEREAKMAKMLFGKDFSDYMAHMTWTKEEGWHHKVIEPYGPLTLDPAGAVLHYGQEVFEGLKAYRHEDGSIWTFRPTYNAARLNYSSRRLAIPEMTHEDFMASVVGLVRADHEWVPDAPGSSFYLRPFIFASDAFLGVAAAARYEYYVIGSPSGPYFQHGFQPINVWVEPTYHRAGPGGMGDAKTGGNYASSLLPKVKAHDEGYDEVLFLDAKTATNLDELGGMNVFVVMADGSVRTPALTGNILPGNTRSCIIQLLESHGREVREEAIGLRELVKDVDSGRVAEMFACGTAAVVTGIGSLTGSDFRVEIPCHDTTKEIYDELTSIQLGKAEDRFGWLYRLM